MLLSQTYIEKKQDDTNTHTNYEKDIVYNKGLQIFFVITLFCIYLYIIFFLGLDYFNNNNN